MNRGYGDGLARAVEIVVTPLLFGTLGYLLDRWLGTDPVLMFVVGGYGVVGVFLKLWLEYDRDMRQHESALARNGRYRNGQAAAAAPADAGEDGP